MLGLDELKTFVAVTDMGSFSGASERLSQTPSGISRSISRLEAKLGMTLITRTTRRLELTEEGQWLAQRARLILAELQATEDHLQARASQPSGLVRVNASTPVLNHLLAPLVADFLDAYPLIRLELMSGEMVVDLIEERADVAIRVGPLSDSTLNARRLGTSRLRLVASPAYLGRHGMPANATDLRHHRLVGFTAPESLNHWAVRHDLGEGLTIEPTISASSGEAVRHLALQGAGIASLSEFMTHDDVVAGRLVQVLVPHALPWTQSVWAVFYKQEAVAPRVAALIDFLAHRMSEALDQA